MGFGFKKKHSNENQNISDAKIESRAESWLSQTWIEDEGYEQKVEGPVKWFAGNNILGCLDFYMVSKGTFFLNYFKL